MNTKREAIEFAKSSASVALDQAGEFASVEAAIESYRENIRDTLNDEKIAEFEVDAWLAYDAEIARLRGVSA